MRASLPFAAAALAGTLLIAVPGSAHHGWGSYEVGYDFPHGTLRLEVPGKTWVVVLAPPSRMRSRGLTPEMMAVGKVVTVVGYPHRTDATELRAERILAGGKTVELR